MPGTDTAPPDPTPNGIRSPSLEIARSARDAAALLGAFPAVRGLVLDVGEFIAELHRRQELCLALDAICRRLARVADEPPGPDQYGHLQLCAVQARDLLRPPAAAAEAAAVAAEPEPGPEPRISVEVVVTGLPEPAGPLSDAPENVAARSARVTRALAGRCTRCGKRPPVAGRRRCLGCADRASKQRESRRRREANRPPIRVDIKTEGRRRRSPGERPAASA